MSLLSGNNSNASSVNHDVFTEEDFEQALELLRRPPTPNSKIDLSNPPEVNISPAPVHSIRAPTASDFPKVASTIYKMESSSYQITAIAPCNKRRRAQKTKSPLPKRRVLPKSRHLVMTARPASLLARMKYF